MNALIPDGYFASVADIDLTFDVLNKGYTSVLLDIDNTVRSRCNNLVPHSIAVWIEKACSLDISVCLVSNNWHQNIFVMQRELGIPVFGKALKPLPFGFQSARRAFQVEKSQMLMVGDQLVTDILGAHWYGIAAYLVAPLAPCDPPYTALMRRFEAGVVASRFPKPVCRAGCNVQQSVANVNVCQEHRA